MQKLTTAQYSENRRDAQLLIGQLYDIPSPIGPGITVGKGAKDC